MFPKISPTACLALVLFPLAVAPGHLAAEEASPASAETRPQSVLRAVPIRHYWDANAWDPAGGSLFWHSRSEKKPSTSRSQAGRNARHAESLTDRPVPRRSTGER